MAAAGRSRPHLVVAPIAEAGGLDFRRLVDA